MDAYDIAKDLDREGKFPGHICYGTSPLLVRAANKLRKQADELTEAGGVIGVLREKVSLQADYIAQLEKGLESSIAMNKAQAERQVKELTNEEIRHIQAICHLKDVGYDNFIMRFARAILRKAQEKW